MDCLFCNIVSGKLNAHVLYESEHVLVFHDIHPQAPSHVLMIPKLHIENTNHVQPEHAHLLAEFMLTIPKVAELLELTQNGYRVVMNTNHHGGQTVLHLHAHILGGRPLTWPPG
jgi:histidine triad (HIT) family protein